MRTINGVDLDDFTYSYLVTALWSSHVSFPVAEAELVDGCMDVADNHPLHGISEEDNCDDHFDVDAFTPEALRSAVSDCVKFQEIHAFDLSDEDDDHAGHDFWLTRNGHGAGFWDGDYEEEKGKRLSDACGWRTNFPELNIWVDEEGHLHFEGG